MGRVVRGRCLGIAGSGGSILLLRYARGPSEMEMEMEMKIEMEGRKKGWFWASKGKLSWERLMERGLERERGWSQGYRDGGSL